MKTSRIALGLAIAAGAIDGAATLAERGQDDFGIGLGLPIVPWFYPPYFTYPPLADPVVALTAAASPDQP